MYWALIYSISEAAYVLKESYIGYASLFNVEEYREKYMKCSYFLQFVRERVSRVESVQKT